MSVAVTTGSSPSQSQHKANILCYKGHPRPSSCLVILLAWFLRQSFSTSFNYFQAFFHTEMQQPAASSSQATELCLALQISKYCSPTISWRKYKNGTIFDLELEEKHINIVILMSFKTVSAPRRWPGAEFQLPCRDRNDSHTLMQCTISSLYCSACVVIYIFHICTCDHAYSDRLQT